MLDSVGATINGNKKNNWDLTLAVDGFTIDSFGKYDVDIRSKNDTQTYIEPTGTGGVYSMQFVISINAGVGSFSDADFTTYFSSPADGGPETLGLATGKFIHGGPEGNNFSAFGVVPEPATIVLMGLGLLGLLRKRKT